MKAYFVNPQTSRLRAGWRLVIFLILFIAITAAGMVGVREMLGSLKKGSLLQFLIIGVTAAVSVYIARTKLDKRTFQSLGLKWNRFAALDLLMGIGNSALVMAAVFLLLLGFGLIEFNGFSWWQVAETAASGLQSSTWIVVGAVFLELLVVAWWEELVMRGYLLQNLIDGTNVLWATVLSSIFFGLSHGFNPNASLLPTLIIAVIAIQLVYAYLKTGQLWLPIGLHLGWNFFQAAVFGFASSGQKSPTLISQTPVGPDWLSGGAFGAEGSILILPIVVLSMVAIHLWVSKSRYPGQGLMAFAPREAAGEEAAA
ncbi:CPBP family intramembrane metalloprotease [bacterium]|nr:CPBP family intramembrane metalloprotease [bacterium]